jgi:hypothetical protein
MKTNEEYEEYEDYKNDYDGKKVNEKVDLYDDYNYDHLGLKKKNNSKKYNLLEIIPYYLAGKRVKRDCWVEVDYLQLDKEIQPKRVTHDKLGKITVPGTTSCKIKLKDMEEQYNNKIEMLNKYKTYYSSPLCSLEYHGFNKDKLWVLID